MAGGASFGDDEEGGVITEINVTPLVDIMLVLLIIFMLTANIITQQSIEVELPNAVTGETTESTTVAFTVDAEGNVYLNGEAADETSLRASLPVLVKESEDIQAIIAADKSVSHGKVIWLIDLIRQLGIEKFALNIDPTPATPEDTPAEAPETP